MKKLMIVVAMMILVLGLSAVAFANDEVDFDVEMAVGSYGIVGDIPNAEGYNNLFGPVVTGEPGLYVSDGNATKDFALSADAWGALLSEDDVLDYYIADGTLDGTARVAKFFVDANTDAIISLAVGEDGWDNWADTPTLFRISSGYHATGLTYSPYPADATGGDWWTNWAYIFNSVEGLEDFAKDDKESFQVDFAKCQGPFEFHINGAMYLPKAGQIAADTYNVELLVTIAY